MKDKQMRERESKLAEICCGDFCASQNSLIPVHPFSSFSALGNDEKSDTCTGKAEHQPQHQFVWFPSVCPSPLIPLSDVSHPICPVVVILCYLPIPLPLSYMSQFLHRSHTKVCTLSILSHIYLSFFGVSSNPINPGNLAGFLHVARLLQWNIPRDVYSEIDPRQRNKHQQRNLLSEPLHRFLKLWETLSFFTFPISAFISCLCLNPSFPLFPSIIHHFLPLFSSHSFCFFLPSNFFFSYFSPSVGVQKALRLSHVQKV